MQRHVKEGIMSRLKYLASTIFIYSEFHVAIETVIKNDPGNMIKAGATVTVERTGGRVRMPSGRTVISWVSHQNMPRVAGRYVLFLTHDFETPNDTPRTFTY